jgi:hypothetical protein
MSSGKYIDLTVITTRVEDPDVAIKIVNNNGQPSDGGLDSDVSRIITAIDTCHRNNLMMQEPDEKQMISRILLGNGEMYSREQVNAYVNARAAEDVFCYARSHNEEDALRLAGSFLSVLHNYEQTVPENIRKGLSDFSGGRNLASEVIKAAEKIAKSS